MTSLFFFFVLNYRFHFAMSLFRSNRAQKNVEKKWSLIFQIFFLTKNLTLSVICYWIDARSLRVASPPPQGETRRLRRTATRNLFVKLTITGFKPEFRDLTKAIIIRVKSSQVKSPWLPLKMSITDIINSPFPEPRWRGWSHTHKYPPPFPSLLLQDLHTASYSHIQVR